MVGDTAVCFRRPLVFLFHFPIDCEKMNKQSMWEGKKFPIFLCTRRRNFDIRAAVRRVEMCPLNDKIDSEEVF